MIFIGLHFFFNTKIKEMFRNGVPLGFSAGKLFDVQIP